MSNRSPGIAVCHVDIAYARGTDDFAGHLFQDSEGDMRSLLFLLQCQADDFVEIFLRRYFPPGILPNFRMM
ncbi:hypothetical protein [Brevibacillus centrosporus]|uniref:hypothetical protein n=1 Tax=Brevibacillus centrosporus TaxID=54910 RepID=UPI003809AC79